MPKNITRIEHITPKVIQRPFANSKEQIFTFDLIEENEFLTSIRNVGAERDFYSIETEDGRVSMEEFFQKFEDKYRPIRDSIVHKKSLSYLSADDFAWLQAFAAIQFLRSRQKRKMNETLVSELAKKVIEVKFNRNRKNQEIKINRDWLKAGQSIQIMKTFGDYSALLDRKDILLFEAKEDEFLLGDGVLVLMNEKDMGPYGSIGFGVSGIQIYFPLSPKFSLGFWCPSILGEFRDALKGMKNVQAQILLNPNLPSASREKMQSEINHRKNSKEELEKIITCHASGEPIPCELEEMKYMNYLQVSQAVRQVFSKSGNFWMLKEILKGQKDGTISKGLELKID